ncbi:MAG: GntR family transcriptional regulator [Lachnospiraceae bacterium]|nr:GntR family transcriptional regulator [Lachnospiraceae bacterium]
MGSSNKNSLKAQVQESLRQRIASGEWRPDTTIPPEMELCSEYNVSRTTMRAAIQDLVDEQLLYRIRGKGTIISPKGIVSKMPHTGLRREIWNMFNNIKPVSASLQAAEPDAGVARRLGIPADESVVRIERLYADESNGLPHTLIYTFLTNKNAAFINLNMLYDTSIGQQLEKNGMITGKTYELLKVSALTKYESGLFGIPAGSPVLLLEEIRYDPDGQPFYFSRYIMRGDMVSIAFTSD